MQDANSIDLDDELFASCISSRDSSGQLGLESEFDLEFPDALLSRDVFESARAITHALTILHSISLRL